jgi:excisionase family DNA binding protein
MKSEKKFEPMGILTLEDVAEYLRLSKNTVYNLSRNGKIPAIRVGNQWRFRMEDIDKWLESQKVAKQGKTEK